MIGWMRLRTATAWCGAFDHGYGAKIGDLHAVENLTTVLTSAASGVCRWRFTNF